MGLRGIGASRLVAGGVATYFSIRVPGSAEVLRLEEAAAGRYAARHAAKWMAALGVACVMVIVGVSDWTGHAGSSAP